MCVAPPSASTDLETAQTRTKKKTRSETFPVGSVYNEVTEVNSNGAG